MQQHGIIDLALVITEKGFLQASTDQIGSDNSSEVGSSISLISASTLPTEARSLKRGNLGGLDFDTDAIPESAKPAFAKLLRPLMQGKSKLNICVQQSRQDLMRYLLGW